MTKGMVYLHIGMGRCGSTAIQRLAQRNQAELRLRGVAYPSAEELGCRPGNSGNATRFAIANNSAWPVKRCGVPTIEQLPQRLHGLSELDVLLSSEMFTSWPIADFHRITKALRDSDFDVRIVVYVRDQSEWLVSAYCQWVVSGKLAETMDDFLLRVYRKSSLDYLTYCDQLAEVVGRPNLIPRLYNKTRMPDGDVRRDLLDVIGVDPVGLDLSNPIENASAGAQEIEILRLINHFLPSRKAGKNRRFLKRSAPLLKELGCEQVPSFRLASPSIIARIREYYEPLNSAFQRRYFPNVCGPLFGNEIPETYEPATPEQRISWLAVPLMLSYSENAAFHRTKELAGADDAIDSRVEFQRDLVIER